MVPESQHSGKMRKEVAVAVAVAGHLGQGGGELTSGESIFHLLPYLHLVYCYKAICDMRSHGFRLKVT